jgi:hypothetical protein
MQRTELARGTINQSDELLIELRQPDNMPATVVIVWPAAPSVASPTAFPTTASKITAIVASAAVRLAQQKAKRL